MTSGQSLANESYFGPPSELIQISDFVHEVSEIETSQRTVFAQSADSLPEAANAGWLKLSEERRLSIADECRYVLPTLFRLEAHAVVGLQLFTILCHSLLTDAVSV